MIAEEHIEPNDMVIEYMGASLLSFALALGWPLLLRDAGVAFCAVLALVLSRHALSAGPSALCVSQLGDDRFHKLHAQSFSVVSSFAGEYITPPIAEMRGGILGPIVALFPLLLGFKPSSVGLLSVEIEPLLQLLSTS